MDDSSLEGKKNLVISWLHLCLLVNVMLTKIRQGKNVFDHDYAMFGVTI